MSSEVSEARSTLWTSVAAAMSPAPWRVHRTTPPQIAAPTIYLDSVELGLETIEGARFTVATFPVVLVADGAVRAQIEALDDVLARVWDAAVAAGGDPEPSRPVALDVGGPTLRAHVLRVGMTITARTLCPSSLATIGVT